MNEVDKIWILAYWLTKSGNRGLYADDCERMYGVNPTAIKGANRTGIIYYSRGWGWRVRKEPHWKYVFYERFPDWRSLKNIPDDMCETFGVQSSFYCQTDADHRVMAHEFKDLFLPNYDDIDWLACVVSMDEWYPFEAGFKRGIKQQVQWGKRFNDGQQQ